VFAEGAMDLLIAAGADLMLGWMVPLSTHNEADRLVGWHLCLIFLVFDCVQQGPIRESHFHGVDCFCHRLACSTSSGKGQTCQVRHKEWA